MSVRRPGLVAGGALLVLVGVLGAEAYLAANGTYLAGGADVVTARVGPPTGPLLRLVVLGDSTAAGVGAPTEAGSLPVLIAERVASDLGRPVEVTGIGVSGARTHDVLAAQVPQLAALAPDVVVIVVGSNDVTHVTAPWTLRRQTARLLEAAHEQAGAPVVLGGIPLFGSASALAQPLRLLVDVYADPLRNAQRAAAAATDGAAFVDISRLASPRFAGVPEAMSRDDFHPSPVGYGFWADALAPAVVDAYASVPPPRSASR